MSPPRIDDLVSGIAVTAHRYPGQEEGAPDLLAFHSHQPSGDTQHFSHLLVTGGQPAFLEWGDVGIEDAALSFGQRWDRPRGWIEELRRISVGD
jgi:hypothetical protein